MEGKKNRQGQEIEAEQGSLRESREEEEDVLGGPNERALGFMKKNWDEYLVGLGFLI